MAYLKSENDQIIVDAVLTKVGREKLASNGKLDIIKFALSDDEIDYKLYNVLNPMGSDYYDVAITKLPILEAFQSDNASLKYKLFSSTSTLNSIPKIVLDYSKDADSNLFVQYTGQLYGATISVTNSLFSADNYFFIVELSNNYSNSLLINDVTPGSGDDSDSDFISAKEVARQYNLDNPNRTMIVTRNQFTISASQFSRYTKYSEVTIRPSALISANPEVIKIKMNNTSDALKDSTTAL